MWPGRDPLGDARPLGSKQRRLSDPPRGGRPKGAGGCGLERLWERAEKTALRNRRCFLVLVSQSLSVCQDAMVAALSRRVVHPLAPLSTPKTPLSNSPPLSRAGQSLGPLMPCKKLPLRSSNAAHTATPAPCKQCFAGFTPALFPAL
mmetsp:Transcript_3536/g.8417  ORF Transcript_3536/g.8417 Transcript_3536/m.8417 type:complete len:147 (+) Transcript_3536:1284-1724(+)